MNYILFTEFITLQALLKELGIIPSGGAIKSFLSQETVLFNGQKEDRRGKKVRVGDIVEIPSQNLSITILQPSSEEYHAYLEDKAEKERVAKLVKKLNQDVKKEKKIAASKQTSVYRKQVAKNSGKKKPVRFPGT